MSDTNNLENKDSQLQVRFLTKEKAYSISSNVFEINRSSTVDELDKIVNSVIKSTNDDHETVEFNYLTNGYLIKKTVDEHLDLIQQESGDEKIIEIEYLIKNRPPEPFKSLNYLDWIGSIHSNDQFILTGCFDGSINVFSIESSKHLLSIQAHEAAVKDVRILDNQYLDQHFTTKPTELYFISASTDEDCKIWKWIVNDKDLKLLYTCVGHIRSVDCLDVYEDKFVTGSSDNMIKMWFMSNENFITAGRDDESKSKKVKNVESSIKNPYTTLAGHNEGITDVCWLNEGETDQLPDIASCSLDNTIKIWDTQVLELKQTLPGPKALLSIDYSPKTRLIIAGLCDNYLRMFDPRAKEGSIVKNAYSSHVGWITSVKWQTDSDYQFVSGSFDSKVKQWDVRSTKAPLFDLIGHDGRVLSVDWTNPNYICSGASDSHLKVYKI